jgi:hypothetical protein
MKKTRAKKDYGSTVCKAGGCSVVFHRRGPRHEYCPAHSSAPRYPAPKLKPEVEEILESITETAPKAPMPVLKQLHHDLRVFQAAILTGLAEFNEILNAHFGEEGD